MNGKLVCPVSSAALLWYALLVHVDYRISMPVTELMVLPNCHGQPCNYACPRCKLILEREFMRFCDRYDQRQDWNGCEHVKIVYPGTHI